MDSIDHCVQDDDYNDLSNYEPEVPAKSGKQMEFEEWKDTQTFSGSYSLNKAREAWNTARRTDPMKQQMYEALNEAVWTYEDWFDDAENCEYIQRCKQAITAYEMEQGNERN